MFPVEHGAKAVVEFIGRMSKELNGIFVAVSSPVFDVFRRLCFRFWERWREGVSSGRWLIILC